MIVSGKNRSRRLLQAGKIALRYNTKGVESLKKKIHQDNRIVVCFTCYHEKIV